ncbi:MAG: hypothetical protein Q4P22_04545 [Eubacteriales bacterium]|nr:hypothetical protein [Eubacteriales bacterium]
MTGIIIILFIIFIVLKNKNLNMANNKRRNLYGQLKETAQNDYANVSAEDYDILQDRATKSSGVKFNSSGFGKAVKRSKPKGNGVAHLRGSESKAYRLEDREHDWLAMQLREEARMKQNIDSEMLDLKKEHLKEHRKIHFG